jgi:hypothetical protein
MKWLLLLLGGGVAYYLYTQYEASQPGGIAPSAVASGPLVAPSTATPAGLPVSMLAPSIPNPTVGKAVLAAGGTPAEALLAAGVSQQAINALIASGATPGPTVPAMAGYRRGGR